MADLKSYFFPLDQAEWIEVCNTRSMRVWRLRTSLFKSQNLNDFFVRMTWVGIVIIWLQKTQQGWQPLYNNTECHRHVQKVLKIEQWFIAHVLRSTPFLTVYIHSARRSTIPSSNSARKPWEHGSNRHPNSFLVWYELVLQRYSRQTSSTFWYKNVSLRRSLSISFKIFFWGRGGWRGMPSDTLAAV